MQSNSNIIIYTNFLGKIFVKFFFCLNVRGLGKLLPYKIFTKYALKLHLLAGIGIITCWKQHKFSFKFCKFHKKNVVFV